MVDEYAYEIEEVENRGEDKLVTVQVTQFSPVATEPLARERARARALVSVGLFNTIFDVFQNAGRDSPIKRLTSIEDMSIISDDRPGKRREYKVSVRQM
jgi:hypothetical protein